MSPIPERTTSVHDLPGAFERMAAHARELYNLRIDSWLRGRLKPGAVADLHREARFAFTNARTFEAERQRQAASDVVERFVASSDQPPLTDREKQLAVENSALRERIEALERGDLTWLDALGYGPDSDVVQAWSTYGQTVIAIASAVADTRPSPRDDGWKGQDMEPRRARIARVSDRVISVLHAQINGIDPAAVSEAREGWRLAGQHYDWTSQDGAR